MRDSFASSFACGLALVLATGAAAAEKPAAPGTSVEMPYLIAPMAVDGKLTSYAYVSSIIVCSSPDAAVAIRNKVPFIQDAFVRDVNARPIAKVDDPQTVDEPALNARMLADARKAGGAGNVVTIKFTQIQVTPVRTGR
ncbi:MAG TPA: hypothetical protein VHW02_15280 [Rhizomicrobium sp.]|jgi:hypothetical protein|nr:hypothetical protein [Rhizomicrobium sp.]